MLPVFHLLSPFLSLPLLSFSAFSFLYTSQNCHSCNTPKHRSLIPAKPQVILILVHISTPLNKSSSTAPPTTHSVLWIIYAYINKSEDIQLSCINCIIYGPPLEGFHLSSPICHRKAFFSALHVTLPCMNKDMQQQRHKTSCSLLDELFDWCPPAVKWQVCLLQWLWMPQPHPYRLILVN